MYAPIGGSGRLHGSHELRRSGIEACTHTGVLIGKSCDGSRKCLLQYFCRIGFCRCIGNGDKINMATLEVLEDFPTGLLNIFAKRFS